MPETTTLIADAIERSLPHPVERYRDGSVEVLVVFTTDHPPRSLPVPMHSTTRLRVVAVGATPTETVTVWNIAWTGGGTERQTARVSRYGTAADTGSQVHRTRDELVWRFTRTDTPVAAQRGYGPLFVHALDRIAPDEFSSFYEQPAFAGQRHGGI